MKKQKSPAKFSQESTFWSLCHLTEMSGSVLPHTPSQRVRTRLCLPLPGVGVGRGGLAQGGTLGLGRFGWVGIRSGRLPQQEVAFLSPGPAGLPGDPDSKQTHGAPFLRLPATLRTCAGLRLAGHYPEAPVGPHGPQSPLPPLSILSPAFPLHFLDPFCSQLVSLPRPLPLRTLPCGPHLIFEGGSLFARAAFTRSVLAPQQGPSP